MNRRDAIKVCGGAALSSTAFAGASSRAAGSSAAALYRSATVIDGNLVASMLSGDADVDAEAAAKIRASGLTAMKQTLGGSGGSYADASGDINAMNKAIPKNAGLFLHVTQVSDIAAAKKSGRVGVIYSFEAASMHEGRLDRIAAFRRRGVRVMGLSYNLRSPFGTGTLVKDAKGLTPLGREAVASMNSLGVSVDLSHSDEPTSFQAIAASTRPVLITHAGCAAVHPHPRNKSDQLLRAVAAKGGVVGVYDLSYLGDYPQNPSLDTYMRHLIHALNTCGEDHVGIGSDTTFLALDTSAQALAAWDQGEADRRAKGIAAPEEGPLPYVRGLQREDRWQVIATQLTRRGYPARAVDKVLGLNFERGFSDTW